MSFALRFHDSLPYSATGHSNVFSRLILLWMPRVQSFHMVVSDHNADLAAPRCARISVLQVDDSSVMDLKYLNLSTCSSMAPWHVMFSVFMAALCDRGAIKFLPCSFFLSSSIFYLFFIPRLISAVADWMSTILLHMVWP